MILHIPSGIFIRFNALAASCAASCAMMRITMAATEPPITFWYSFFCFPPYVLLFLHAPVNHIEACDQIKTANTPCKISSYFQTV